MKSLKDIFFAKSSVIKVLMPFFCVYKLFGRCAFDINSKDFNYSVFGVVAYIVNFLCGIYHIIFKMSYELGENESDFILEIGLNLTVNTGIIFSVVITLVNFATRNHLRKLLAAFVKYDALAKTILPVKHEKCFLAMITFWMLKSSSFLLVSPGIPRSWSTYFLNFYLNLVFYLEYEIGVLMLILVAHRMRIIKQSIKEIQTSDPLRRDFETIGKLKIVSILLNQIFNIVELVSKCFGCQLMIFFISSSLVGMFTIFSGIQILLNSESIVSNRIFCVFKFFSVFDHVFLIFISYVIGFINQEVLDYFYLNIDLIEKIFQAEEIRKFFRAFNSSQDQTKLYDPLLKEVVLTCGLFSIDWKFFTTVSFSIIQCQLFNGIGFSIFQSN